MRTTRIFDTTCLFPRYENGWELPQWEFMNAQVYLGVGPLCTHVVMGAISGGRKSLVLCE